jgi:putative FmdB family regulatory protein
MPLYEYHCAPCDRTFETLIRSSSDQPHCPDCGSIEVDKQLSVPAAAQSTGGRNGALPMAQPAASPSSFGCGRPQCGAGTCAGLG